MTHNPNHERACLDEANGEAGSERRVLLPPNRDSTCLGEAVSEAGMERSYFDFSTFRRFDVSLISLLTKREFVSK